MQAVATLRAQSPQPVRAAPSLPQTATAQGRTFQAAPPNSDAAAAFVTPAKQVDRGQFQWAPGAGPSQMSAQMPSNIGQGLSAVGQALFNRQKAFPQAPGGNNLRTLLTGLFGLGGKGGLY